jgi:hypothetical protein
MVSGYTRVLEKFEDSKGVIRGPKSSRTDNTMAKRKRTDNTMAKKRKTDNTMAKRRRTDNVMAKKKRTDNTMARRKRTKKQAIVDKIPHRRLKIEQHEAS